jgi:hypothetical protein
MGWGAVSSLARPFFSGTPPRPSAFETPKGRICCATLATGTTSPNPGSRYPARPASTHPAPPGFAAYLTAYLLRSGRKRPVFSGYLIGYQPFGYRLFAANLSANQIPANQKKGPFAGNQTGSPSNCVQQKTDPPRFTPKPTPTDTAQTPQGLALFCRGEPVNLRKPKNPVFVVGRPPACSQSPPIRQPINSTTSASTRRTASRATVMGLFLQHRLSGLLVLCVGMFCYAGGVRASPAR